MSRITTEIIAQLILPPCGPLLVMLFGLTFYRRNARLALAAFIFCFLSLWVSSAGVVGGMLTRAIEYPPAQTSVANVSAIVILGGGLIQGSPEYVEDTVSAETLGRLRYGAHLARENKIPLMVVGGRLYGSQKSEAEAMAKVLRDDFAVATRWQEKTSTTTAENAVNAHTILAADGISHIGLVTAATHMPRAVAAFRSVGFRVVAYPTAYIPRAPLRFSDFLPSAAGLLETRNASRELLGLAWYWIRGLMLST